MKNLCDMGRPYVFVSYSHRNAIEVQKTISELIRKFNLNIWYDGELIAGKNWDSEAMSALRAPMCKAVLCFISEDFVISEAVKKELYTANRYRKTIVPINMTSHISYDDLLISLVNEYNGKDDRKIEIAEEIIDNYFDNRLTYIVMDLESDKYYEDIYYTVRKVAPEILKTETSTARPLPEPEPEPAPEPEEQAEAAPPSEGQRTSGVSYVIYGKSFTKKQSEMMFDVFSAVIEKHPGRLDELVSSLNCLSFEDYEQTWDRPVQFRGCKTYTVNGKSYCIGTSYGMADKLKFIAKLLKICGEPEDVLRIDGYELPSVRISSGKTPSTPAPSGQRGSQANYTVYGQSCTKNQSEMMFDVFSAVIEKHPNKLDELVSSLNCLTFEDYETNRENAPNYFRSCRTFRAGGRSYCVGTAYSLYDKLKLIRKLLSICGEDSSAFTYDN